MQTRKSAVQDFSLLGHGAVSMRMWCPPFQACLHL